MKKYEEAVKVLLKEENYYGVSKAYIIMAELILSNYSNEYLEASKYYDKASKYYALDNETYNAAKYSEMAALTLIENPKNEFRFSHYNHIIRYCVNAKNYYGNAGYYEESGKLFKKEMHYRMLVCFNLKKFKTDYTTVDALSSYLKGISYFINEKFLGFGESILRILITTLCIITSFAVLYGKFALVTTTTPDISIKAYDYFFYSAAAFATVNYGNFIPNADPIARVLVVTEAFIGVFVMALIVLVVSRKFSRR